MEQAELKVIHRLVSMVMTMALAMFVFGIILSTGLGIEVVRTELAIRDIRTQAQELAKIRSGRADDIAAQTLRNCSYTKDFVGVFHSWALGLDNAERKAAAAGTATESERQWHESRIGTYSTLFQSLDILGTNACPKAVK